MKKIQSILMAAVLLVAFATGCKYATEGNFEVSAVAFTVTVAMFTLLPGSSRNALGFMNKSYFAPTQNPWTRAEIALIQHLTNPNRAKAQSIADFESGRLKLETYARAFRFKIASAATGRIELLNAASTYVQGAIPEEFNFGALPDGYNISVTHIRSAFVADAALTTPQSTLLYVSQPNTFPSALRNGQFIFSQAGAVKSFVDVIATGSAAAGFGSVGENDGLELQAPFILEENKSTKFELYGGSGQAFASPAGGNMLEIVLFGAMVRLRS